MQDKISNALVTNPTATSLNPFMVLKELSNGLQHHSLIHDDELREHYRQLISIVKDEYTDIVKNEVQRAIAADEEAMTRLCANYLDNVKAYTQKEKVKNKFTGEKEEPDERLMRSIEERIDIPETRKDDFRREIMNYIGALSLDGKKFDYRTNERLHKALELKALAIGGQMYGPEDLEKVTSLPTREEALARLAGLMQAPVTKLASTLHAVPSNAARTLAAIPSKFVRTVQAVHDQKAAAGG